MANKIKFFVGFLALIALFSVLSFFNSLSDKSASFAVISAQTPLANPDNDPDHDGLTNKEESYWNTDFQNPDTDGDGFLDGEEVASGHDPLIPGPNDLLVKESNLTTKLSTLALAGLYEGSLKPNSPKFEKSANQLIDEIVFQSKKTSPVDLPNLQIITENKDNEKNYLVQMKPLLLSIIKNNGEGAIEFLNLISSVDITENSKNTKLVNLLDTQTLNLDKQIGQLRDLKIPKNWVPPHSNLLSTLISLKNNYTNLIKASPEDPLKKILTITGIIYIFSNYLPAATEIYTVQE